MMKRYIYAILLTILYLPALPAFPDQPCDMSPLPLAPRIENRNFPSLFYGWGQKSQWAPYDLIFCCPRFNLELVPTDDGYQFQLSDRPRSPFTPVEVRDRYLEDNPYKVFLIAIDAVWGHVEEYGEHSPFWMRDENGDIEMQWGAGLHDLNHPEFQEVIFKKAEAIDRCGLYDGIIFDGWNEYHAEKRGHLRAQGIILKGIRERVRDDFLILANTNDRKAPVSAPYLNGLLMETGFPGSRQPTGHRSIETELNQYEDTLRWAETNLREPVLNAPTALSIVDEDPYSPDNIQWMRALTTLSLTFSDGYFMYHDSVGGHRSHLWYDFWDANLGRPVGETLQLYDNRPGLYIREFTNGWAVYNHSGEAHVVTLPEEVQSVTSGLINTEQAVLNLDGDIFLKIPPVLPGDINGDGIVNILDLTLVAQAFGTDSAAADVNADGVVNVFDLVFVANQF